MTGATGSYLKVQYELRPAKQVERRMLMEGLLALRAGGFRLEDYEYIGFGSIYYVDFVLFHRWLSVRKMVSVEHDDRIARRARFNLPFDLVSLRVGSAKDVLAGLQDDSPRLVWLDFDSVVSGDVAETVSLAATRLAVGSILLVTVDSDPPGDGTLVETRSHFETEVGSYLPYPRSDAKFRAESLPLLNSCVVDRIIKERASARGLKAIPLFDFEYADGHQMITAGIMIGTASTARRVSKSGFYSLPYARRQLGKRQFRIRVPKVTRLERLYLDSFMPCADGWEPAEFELDPGAVADYRQVYRYLPHYAELLL